MHRRTRPPGRVLLCMREALQRSPTAQKAPPAAILPTRRTSATSGEPPIPSPPLPTATPRYPDLIMKMPLLVAFDLDDTLAPSKAKIDDRIADLLRALLRRVDVAIISGGNEQQFRSQVIARLGDAGAADLARLHLLPTCGTRYLRHDGSDFAAVYAHDLSDAEKSAAL